MTPSCWACPITRAVARCRELSAEREDAAAVCDWGRFDALGRELRVLMRQRFAVGCGCEKPLALAWLDLLAVAKAKEARRASADATEGPP